MIDTHAHLYLCSQPIANLIAHAKQSCVTKIVNVALNLETAATCLEIQQQFPMVFPTIGIYPGEYYDDTTFDQMRQMVESNQFVAIGEIGLDYFKNRTPASHQRTAFIRQLSLAQELDMPVIIHNRHSETDMIDIMSSFSHIKKVFHCFGSDTEFIERVMTNSSYFSFTGNVTYAKKGKTIRAIKALPLEKIMIETDCPYLTPAVYKPQENQPAYVVEVAKRIAEIKSIPIQTVIDVTTQTAFDFFNI
jgi:TatD DNase family protein